MTRGLLRGNGHRIRRWARLAMALAAAIQVLLTPVWAIDRGAVTNLPIPRYVSLKASEANARRGPALAQRIDWVFTRKGMPLQIIGEYENWRQVRDRDGATGWVHYTLLSGVRTVIVVQDMLPLRVAPEDGAATVARAERGVVARLGDCNIDWCRITVEGYRGWVRKTALWGVTADETRD